MTFMDERDPPPEGNERLHCEDDPGRQYVDFSDYVRSFEPPDYLIDKIMLTGRVYSLTAMTGHLKTAFATYAGLAVACGGVCAGLETKRARVLYLSGENDEDQKARTIATAAEFEYAPELGYFTVLAGADAIGVLKDEIPHETAKLGPIGLVIVDTSIAYFGGEDENSNIQLKDHASMFRALGRNLGGATVLILCHPTKNPGKDALVPRGGGAFLAEIDGNLTLYRQEQRVTLHHQGKFRGASFEPIEFCMKLVTLENYKDRRGRPIESVVISPISELDAIKMTREELRDEDKLLFELLHHPDLSQREWAENCNWLDENGNGIKSRVNRILKVLESSKLVQRHRDGKKWLLTEAGKKEAKEIK